MIVNVGKELAALRRMSVDDLRSRYAEVFGETTNGRHKDWLIKRILYRLQALSRANEQTDPVGPPFTGLLPAIEVFEMRGPRMLDAKLWRKKCFSCMWANKSAVEIEYKFDRVKRYRKETFCYGPRSCPFYNMGPPREVQYFDSFPSMDDGWLDELCIERRGDED
jgi:hypothetical protein